MTREILIEVKNLKTHFPVKRNRLKEKKKVVKAVDNISLVIYKGETLGVVGESGSGKSTLGRTILKLIEPTSGDIYYRNTPITTLKGSELQKYRNEMQMVFQDPFSSLNPRMRVGDILQEPMKLQLSMSKEDRQKRVLTLLEKVGMRADAADKFPHEFSGGQRQRIGIARALAINPAFIIGDEPVSALDVSVQSQVLNLMMDLQEEFDLTYLFISHDLSVVKHISDRVAVMYLGNIVEIGEKENIFATPKHPYTQALLQAIPVVDFTKKRETIPLKGDLPNPMNPPIGCVFHTRCPYVMPKCEQLKPLLQGSEAQQVACFLYEEEIKNVSQHN